MFVELTNPANTSKTKFTVFFSTARFIKANKSKKNVLTKMYTIIHIITKQKKQ